MYNLLAMRDLLMRRCKEFKIPTEWMFDSGIISKVIHTYTHNKYSYILFLFFLMMFLTTIFHSADKVWFGKTG